MKQETVITDWNVVATTQSDSFLRAQQLLARFGAVASTDLYNVIVMRVNDPSAFLRAFADRAATDPRLLNSIARIVPLRHTFDFSGRDEFERRATESILRLAGELEGRSFHVRVKRRGHKGEISSRSEETLLQTVLIGELARRGRPGRISYDDPDAIIDVETAGDRAGLSLWTREDIARFPFLKTD